MVRVRVEEMTNQDNHPGPRQVRLRSARGPEASLRSTRDEIDTEPGAGVSSGSGRGNQILGSSTVAFSLA